MSYQRLIVTAGLCAGLLIGCQSSQPAGPKADADVAAADGMAPPSDYRKALLWQALRGLRYDSGRVEIDEAVAGEIAQRGTREQALAEYERGRELLLRQNMRIKAIAAHTRAVIIDPDEPIVYDGLGVALLTKGKTAEAAAAFRTALDLDPQFVAARFHLADVLQRQGRFDEAASELREVLRQQPNHGDAHGRLAIVLYYLNEDEQAWEQVHATEALGASVPPQFRALLARRTPEPGK